MRNKILYLCISSILVALLIQTALFQNTSTKTIYEQTKEANLNLLNNMQEDINSIITEIESNLLLIYDQKELMEALQQYHTITDMREENYRVAYNMAQTFGVEEKVVAIYIYDGFNRIVSAYRHASTPIYNYPEDLFQDIAAYNVRPLRKFMNQENNIMLVSSYYNENRGKDIIRFALNIFSQGYPRKKLGCIVCDVDSDVYSKILGKYAYGENDIIWLQPIGDRVIVAEGVVSEEYHEEYERLIADIKIGKRDRELNLKINGGVLFNISNSKYNLEIFSLMSPSLLVKNQRILTRNLVVIAIFLLAVFGFEAILIARGITEPLEYLTNTMREIRKGDMELRVKPLGSDEIGELGDNFNKMLDEMEEMITQEYKNQIMLQKAEYKALQAQINPHFLYNTLDTMSSIAQIQECNLVSNLSESLSAIFRYCLDMKNPMSTIEKEILHIKNYIYVMDVRMHNSVKYIFDIDESMLQLEIPRLTLQPIVENALKYGVWDMKGEKIIKVTVLDEGDVLAIQVEDNGAGMDPELLNQQLLQNDIHYVEKGDSIGLSNINARIKLLFGSAYGVHVESGSKKGTAVTVKLPNMKEEKPNGWEKV